MRRVDFLILGAGQLGSRHGQSLAKLKGAESITFVDPDPQSLETATARVQEVSKTVSVRALTELTQSVGRVKLAVVSTSSLARFQAVKSMLEFSIPEVILLEKLLAPDSATLNRLVAEVDFGDIPTFVNCPMPHFDHYRSSAQVLAASESTGPLTYEVFSNTIGLVTNSIHYLDHFFKLCGGSAISFVKFAERCQIVESKRQGYSEIVGSIFAETVAGDRLVITFEPRGTKPEIRVEIRSGDHEHIFDELEEISTLKAPGVEVISRKISTPHQSELTHLSLERLTSNQEPYWTPFEESVYLHSLILDALATSAPQRDFT